MLTSGSEHRAKTRHHDIIDKIAAQPATIAFENT
jgi:hypothetical protein